MPVADFADSPQAIAEIDLDGGTLLAANAAALALYGLAPGTLAGCPLQALSGPLDDAARRFAELALAPGSAVFRWRHWRADGTPWEAELRPLRLVAGPPRRLLFIVEDVSARWRAEQALQQIERHPDLAARVGRACAWEIWPRQGRIVFDPRLPTLMGYAAGELGESLADWMATIPAAEQPRIAAALQAVAEGRSERYAIEHMVLRKDGSTGWVHVHGERVGGPAERAPRIVGSTVDITERKRFERELELTQFAVDHSPDAIFWINDQGQVVRANPQASRNLGLGPEALRGRSIWSFDPDFTPQAWRPLLERLQREGSLVFETRHRRADGGVFPVEISTSLIPFDGKSYGFCVVRDITERKQAEQALRELNEDLERRVRERGAELERQHRRSELILASAIDGFFATDATGRVIDTNAAFCSLLGYTREELLRLAIPDFEASESPQEVARHIERVRRLGYDRFDTRHRRRDGGVVEVEISVHDVRLADETLLFAFVRDIGEREAARRALQAAKDAAERANRAKSEFLSRMSHELRTPLNAILGFGQLLELNPSDPHQTSHVREILGAGRHLLTLIDEVLDLARVESGHLAVSPEPVTIGALIDECLTLLRPLAGEAHIRLDAVPADCTVHVRADRTRLKQVLLNLLSNAVKYNRPGGSVRLDCSFEPAAAPTTACIRVHDTGAGLTPEQRQRLFVPFERLDADVRRIQGTGIGLALSRRLVELMGGTIGVDSTPGQGSIFWVRLPLAQALPGAGQPAADAAMAITPAPAAGAARHDVLCIEDNPANLRLIEGVLAQRPELRLLTAINPGLGLELARSHRPALILLDIHLPDMDGFAVLECLREHEATRGIPVIGVSANAMPRDVERARAAGFRAYLTKPLDIARLLQIVDETLAAPAG